MKKLLLPAAVLVLFAASAHPAPAPGRGAIASADPRATAAGLLMLEQGGNAFDAAVAIASTLAVVEPAGSGLGGGGFFLTYEANAERYRFIDAREVAPAAATADMYLDAEGEPVKGASVSGPLAAAIPGEAAGLVHLADNYGTLPLKTLLQPAIAYAEKGFRIGPRALLGLRFRRETILRSPAMAAVFLRDGELPEIDAVIVQPDLARTLRRLARGGFDGFYEGPTAERLVAGVRAAGGIWTRADLRNYRVVERLPLVTEYAGMRVVTAPPPSSGGVVMAQLFQFLSGYPLMELEPAQRKHVLIEGMRRAYRDRAEYLGDPDFVDMPLRRLLAPGYIAAQRASVSMERATPSAALPSVFDDGSSGTQTTHFSVLDAAGNRVAATITVNTWYGAAFMPPGTGVVLNNEMDDFSIKPGVPNEFNLIGNEANAIAPGKRPLSSMSPTFLEGERGLAIVGTPGGSRIITMVLRAALAWWEGSSAAEMAALPRFHHQYLPDVVNYEAAAIPADEAAVLESLGHTLRPSRRGFGNMNIVTWDAATGAVEAATDPRGEGEGRVY